MEIRRAVPADTPAVLQLLSRSLGWLPDEKHAAFFAWKHERNPFGPSLAWVAEEEGCVIGFRTFMRWEFEREGEVVRAARAVDTATHPDHRGKGVFSRLTLHGLGELHAAGVAFVFNTPNDQSRPGYLKMGWQVLGRLPTAIRPRSLGALGRMARARTAADLWSTPTGVAAPAGEALADSTGIEELLGTHPTSPSLRTRQSAAYLSWRYGGLASLHYRAHLAGRDVAGGLALFRLRRRGAALEATIGDLLVPGADPRRASELARDVLRASGADYAVSAGPPFGRLSGFAPLPRHGPIVAWRGLGAPPSTSPPAIEFCLGDVELF